MYEAFKGNRRGLDTRFRREMRRPGIGKSEKCQQRFVSLGFLTKSGVWFSGLGQPKTRTNGLLRLPIQEAVTDHPHIHTQTPASSPTMTTGNQECVMPCSLIDTLLVKEMSLYSAQAPF